MSTPSLPACTCRGRAREGGGRWGRPPAWAGSRAGPSSRSPTWAAAAHASRCWAAGARGGALEGCPDPRSVRSTLRAATTAFMGIPITPPRSLYLHAALRTRGATVLNGRACTRLGRWAMALIAGWALWHWAAIVSTLARTPCVPQRAKHNAVYAKIYLQLCMLHVCIHARQASSMVHAL